MTWIYNRFFIYLLLWLLKILNIAQQFLPNQILILSSFTVEFSVTEFSFLMSAVTVNDFTLSIELVFGIFSLITFSIRECLKSFPTHQSILPVALVGALILPGQFSMAMLFTISKLTLVLGSVGPVLNILHGIRVCCESFFVVFSDLHQLTLSVWNAIAPIASIVVTIWMKENSMAFLSVL